MKLSGAPCACGCVGVLKDEKYRAVQQGISHDMRLYNCVGCKTTRVRVIEASRRTLEQGRKLLGLETPAEKLAKVTT